MTIDYAEIDTDTKIVEKPGVRQVTNEKSGGRYYQDCAPGDDRWPETDMKFTSVTEALRTGWPTSFEGAAKAFIANTVWERTAEIDAWRKNHDAAVKDAGTDAYLLEQAAQYRKDKLREIREYADQSLALAAARGTAVHSYIEDRLNGNIPDWECIVACRAETWIAAVDKFLEDCKPEVVLAEVTCFDRVNEVAGTCDAVVTLAPIEAFADLAGTWELDWKSRT